MSPEIAKLISKGPSSLLVPTPLSYMTSKACAQVFTGNQSNPQQSSGEREDPAH